MKRLVYNIETRQGLESVTGWTTGTAGLATHKHEGLGKWTTDHLASGYNLGPFFDTRAEAVRYAELLVDACDWTQDREIVCSKAVSLASAEAKFVLANEVKVRKLERELELLKAIVT